MLKIWGRLSSINVQKVVWCADELGLPYERTEAGGSFGVVDTPEYLAMNPNGLVPVIEDDGFVLWESNAIVRYLAARHGEGWLWPDDLRLRAEADRWMDWQNFTYSPAMSAAFRGLVRTVPEKRDAQAIEASRQMSEEAAAILEAHLATREYVAGGAFTVGDIPVALATQRWFGVPIEHEKRPNLQRWLERLRARKGAARVLSLPVT
jgi:glutathione S-transferase